jgi:thiamine biosynthesis protein ThiI
MATLEDAIARRTVQNINEVMENLGEHIELRVVADADETDIVIDIRHPDEQERKPLSVDNTILIPFYTLNREFESLAKDKSYLLYCDKGIMSQLHAAHLYDAGHSNVGVYRPKA